MTDGMRWARHREATAALGALALIVAIGACAPPRSGIYPANCSKGIDALVDVPGNPFQALASADGCHVFVSLAGPVEPGDPRRPPRPGAPPGGVALIDLSTDRPRVSRVLTLEGSPYGMVLTHDGSLLIVAADDRVAFVDTRALIAGSSAAVLGYLVDAPLAGRFYANVTRDDRWLFVSDESERSISVVDLVRARASHFAASSVIGRIPTGRAPIALAFSPDDRLLYTTTQEAPGSFGWPADCRAPGSDTSRFQSKYPRGVIAVIDVAKATRDPANSVISAVAAGCNPVRLATSPDGAIAYVTARTDNELLAFDTRKLLSNSTHALIGRVPVGSTPVGVITLKDGDWVAVTNSNRFAASSAPPSMTLIDARRFSEGKAAILGTLPTGAFPRELSVTRDGRTLLLTNFDSKTLAIIDIAKMKFFGLAR
jgi:DNA-binding beta-propeller fold protein YncE